MTTHILEGSRRLDPKVRKESILDVAIQRAMELGFDNIRRDDIADKAGVAQGLVTRYFTTMTQLKRAVMRAAVHRGILSIIAQGIVAKHPEALKASEELKQQALSSLSA
jgi:AcrR family transcriptional regulator